VRFFRSKRGVVTLGVLLLVALLVIRPGANRLRTRIVSSISLALGHPVEVASLNLRLLPRPGFDLKNFVVHDDPGFSAEPMLRAEEVTASLRLSSLLRGRLEIARLNLTEPSLNLVRNPEGHWNLENLVERAAKIPVAPTGKAKTETRPGFPYIEADRGRINFKFGAEKKPYALTEADFALWQDSENAWGMRLKAQPVRTDFNLSDTGTVRVNGMWQRAKTLRDTPLQFSLQWDRAQLGQVTKLAYGDDMGWRGAIRLSTTLTGTPSDLALEMGATVEDFRRYDILGGGELRLAAQCSGQYRSADYKLSDIACRAPVGEGTISVAGSIAVPLRSGGYDFSLVTQDMPIESLMTFFRHVRTGTPDDLAASGRLKADLRFRRDSQSERSRIAWEGSGETSDFRLESKLTNTELLLDKVPFSLSSQVAPLSSAAPASQAHQSGQQPQAEARVDIGPFDLTLGKSPPALVRGWLSRSGYGFSIQGDVQVQRLLRVARTVGIGTPQLAADGPAKVNLQVAGNWSGVGPPRAIGKAQLHSIRAEVRGLNAPLEIAAATLTLTPDQVNVQNLTASLAGAAWHGSLTLPRQCAVPGTCPVRFDLHADELSTDRLNQALNPHINKQPWYRFLSSSTAGSPYLLTLNAAGRLTANQVMVRKLVANRVSANVELKTGKLRLYNLSGDVLGGRQTGEWKADFTAKPPQYSGSGTLEKVSLNRLAEVMKDGWVTGSATATYHATAAGLSAAELFASATGALQVEVRDGLLPHVALAGGTGPLAMHFLAAHLFLHDGKFEIQEGRLETGTGVYEVSGTASLGRVLNVNLTRDGAPGFNITGTLTEPRVSQTAAAETRAALKP
jgi:hypothetical protein